MKFKSPIFVALSFMIVNFALRIGFLASQDIALDEPFTLFWSQQSLRNIWNLAAFENNPPLHFIITHFWIKLFGLEAFWVRLPSLIFAISGIGLLIEYVGKKSSLFASILIGVLLTLSSENIFYSQEARSYSLLFLLTVLAFRAISKIIENPLNRNIYLELAVVNILLIYTHYLSSWIFIAEIITWLIYCRSIPAFKKSIPSILLFLLAFSPLAFAAISRLNHMQSTGSWVPKTELSQLYGHINILLNGSFGTIIFILLVVFGLVLSRKRFVIKDFTSSNLTLPVLWFLIIYFGLFIQSMLFQPVFIPRYLFFSSVPLFVLMASLLDKIIVRDWMRSMAILFMVIGLLPGFSLNPSNNRKMSELTNYIISQKTPQTALVICPASFDLAYIYHANPEVFKSTGNFQSSLEKLSIYAVQHFDELPDSIKSSAQKIIYLDADAKFTLPQNSIKSQLEQSYQLKEQEHFDLIFDVYVFEPKVSSLIQQ